MNVQEFRFATVEQFFEHGIGTDIDLLQLSPGPLDFSSTQVELAGVQLRWNRVGARIRSREVYRGSGVKVGFVLQSPNRPRLCGHELDAENVVVWHSGKELDYIAPTGLASLIVQVDAALADLLGWTLVGDPNWPVPISRLLKLQRTCRLATQAARRQVGIGVDAGVDARALHDGLQWRDRILADLEPTLERWLTPLPPPGSKSLVGTKHFRLAKDAERFFEQYNPGQSVAAVAEALGVSRRTLFYAFREWAGLGPHAYMKLVSLHRLRDGLLSASPSDTTVTRLATEFGFSHMGRLSADYHEHFGEYPSDTLRRC